MMPPPRSFPYPIGIGVDLVHVPRLARILASESHFNAFVKRNYNRIEWPDLCLRVQKTLNVCNGNAESQRGASNCLTFPMTLAGLKGNESTAKISLLRYLAGR